MFEQFDVAMPNNLDEALAILADEGANGTLTLAGGTNMIVDLRARRLSVDKLVSLKRVPELRGIKIENGRVTIGAGTTVSEILNHPKMTACANSLVEAANVFGGMMVRNSATIAGNICSDSPAADLVPPLMALGAEVALVSTQGRRDLPISEFYTGFKENARRPDELISEISWDIPPPRSSNLFYKLARRKGDAITVVGMAAYVESDQRICTEARIILGSVAPTVKRAIKTEALLIGNFLDAELIDDAAKKAADESSPIDDERASATYRRHGVRVLTTRLLTKAWKEISE